MPKVAEALNVNSVIFFSFLTKKLWKEMEHKLFTEVQIDGLL